MLYLVVDPSDPFSRQTPVACAPFSSHLVLALVRLIAPLSKVRLLGIRTARGSFWFKTVLVLALVLARGPVRHAFTWVDEYLELVLRT